MHVLVTAGGTREPIDEVRFVSNVSTGRLGATIAETLLAAGEQVTLLAGVGSVRPGPHPRLTIVEFGSTRDLLDRLLASLAAAGAAQVMIHAAAVADYAPEPVRGKIKSNASELVLRLLPTPKVADAVRRSFPRLKLVLFKLESRISRDELFARATATRVRVGADAIVANLLEDVGPADHQAWLLRADGSSEAFADRAALACGLLAEVRRLGHAAAAEP